MIERLIVVGRWTARQLGEVLALLLLPIALVLLAILYGLVWFVSGDVGGDES